MSDPSGWESASAWKATAEGHQRSLRSKLVLSLAATCAVFLMVDEAVRRFVIQPAFEDLEKASALRDTNRVMSAIKVESEHLRTITDQFSARLASTDLTSLHDSPHNNALLQQGNWQFEGIQWAAIAGSDQSWHWIRTSSDGLPSRQTLSDDITTDSLISASILHRISADKNGSVDGLVCGAHRKVHAFAIAKIDTQDPTGTLLAEQEPSNSGETIPDKAKTTDDQPTTYCLVTGKELNDELIAELRRRTQVTFSIQVYHKQQSNQRVRTWEADESTLVVEVPLVKEDDQTLANLFVQVPRDVVRQAQHTTSLARDMFVCGAAVTLVLMLLQLQRLVVGPLTRIRKHAEKIAENGFDAAPLAIQSNDEIGALATALDQMKRRIVDTQNRLADTSHAAGMSQVADTVIHNVGNVLTNVNSLIETAVDRVEGLRITPLEKLATRLRQDENQAALIQATPDYLQRLSAELQSDQHELSEMLAILSDNVQHIHSVIRDQRRHTMKSVDNQSLSLREIVQQAVSCCQATLQQDAIVVELNNHVDCQVISDRSLLLQIIINLIGNAGNAMGESDCHRPLLQISILPNDKTARLQIRDHGCGMTPETLSKVFDAHFTTRTSGTGLGLHFCAITLKKLGGKISAHSDGIGKGATFMVELPLANPNNSQTEHFIGAPVETSNLPFANTVMQAKL